MNRAAAIVFEPRKTPVQAPSAASVDAILEATTQVLVKHGKTKFTTARVAERAGVSIGTLYQYFPNKSALLQALLRAKLSSVASSIEELSKEMCGAPLGQIADALVKAFVAAKFKDPDASVALYAVMDDLESKKIAHEMHSRSAKAIRAMIESSSEKVSGDLGSIAQTLQSAIFGVSRATLEDNVKLGAIKMMEQELRLLARAYLRACSK